MLKFIFSWLLLAFILIFNLKAGFSDEFYELDFKERKIAFIDKIRPLIILANETTISRRDFCVAVVNEAWKSGFIGFDKKQYADFLQIVTDYKIKNIYNLKEFFIKLEAIPISLAIAQAALESGWGNSRFVKEANNIFGHWTWDLNGLVPLDRQEGKTHRIRIFESLNESVAMYVLNLNSNEAYSDFRELRYKFALRGEIFDGLTAIKTMQNYSELGDEYISMIRNLIKQFNLTKFDY